jgi:hypothetical protein
MNEKQENPIKYLFRFVGEEKGKMTVPAPVFSSD